MPSHSTELLKAARAVARYQRTIRELRRRIKDAQKNLRLEQRHLRALAQLVSEPDVAPLRLFSGDVGMKATRRTVTSGGTSDDSELFPETGDKAVNS